MSGWLLPLLATLLMQIMNAFASRCITTLAPVLTENAGIGPAMIGIFAGLGTLATVLVLMIGVPFIKRFGPVRMLQAGVVFAALGLLAVMSPHWGALLLGSVLVGIGYGPSSPSGSDILSRHAPPGHRSLIFSIKQSGVPLGGAMAGLMMPYLVYGNDVSAAVISAAALCAASVFAVQAVRERIDCGRDAKQRISRAHIFSWHNMTTPIRILSHSPALPRIVFAGFCFAFGQGALIAFLVTFLVNETGFSLKLSGEIFALFNAVGVFGRVALGWLSDRLGSAALTLCALGAMAAATAIAFAFMAASWPVWMIAAVAGAAGVTMTSWNALILSETARLSPQDQVAETTSGATTLIFMGYVAGPAAFALLTGASGAFWPGFAMLAALGAAAAVSLVPLATPGMREKPPA